MKIVITGSQGFIAKNLRFHLIENGFKNIYFISKETNAEDFEEILSDCEIIYHLAGENRPKDNSDFYLNNVNFTQKILDTLSKFDNYPKIIFSSSTKVKDKTDYGISKLDAENLIIKFCNKNNSIYRILRLPNIFGKWCKPNYNSFIATFCYNIMNNIEINIDDDEAEVELLYIDDLCKIFLEEARSNESSYVKSFSTYRVKVGDVAKKISNFKNSRKNLRAYDVGEGFDRCLYSTYISYYQPNSFVYELSPNKDERGVFTEVLKTERNGQFSYFTALPGITRGGHYHHTKTEKFIILKGEAKFNFKNIDTDEKICITTDENDAKVVETIPGWSHDITNTGDDLLIVMIWANEVFNSKKPDTIKSDVL